MKTEIKSLLNVKVEKTKKSKQVEKPVPVYTAEGDGADVVIKKCIGKKVIRAIFSASEKAALLTESRILEDGTEGPVKSVKPLTKAEFAKFAKDTDGLPVDGCRSFYYLDTEDDYSTYDVLTSKAFRGLASYKAEGLMCHAGLIVNPAPDDMDILLECTPVIQRIVELYPELLDVAHKYRIFLVYLIYQYCGKEQAFVWLDDMKNSCVDVTAMYADSTSRIECDGFIEFIKRYGIERVSRYFQYDIYKQGISSIDLTSDSVENLWKYHKMQMRTFGKIYDPFPENFEGAYERYALIGRTVASVDYMKRYDIRTSCSDFVEKRQKEYPEKMSIDRYVFFVPWSLENLALHCINAGLRFNRATNGIIDENLYCMFMYKDSGESCAAVMFDKKGKVAMFCSDSFRKKMEESDRTAIELFMEKATKK